MASVLLYLALSACATTAVGVFAGSEDWDRWSSSHPEEHCDRADRAGIHVGGISAHAQSRRQCHAQSGCYAGSEGARCEDDG